MVGSGPPPPPPPPMPNFNSGGGNEPVSGLAAALQAAKLKKTPKSTENSGGSTTSSSGSSGYGSIGKEYALKRYDLLCCSNTSWFWGSTPPDQKLTANSCFANLTKFLVDKK